MQEREREREREREKERERKENLPILGEAGGCVGGRIPAVRKQQRYMHKIKKQWTLNSPLRIFVVF